MKNLFFIVFSTLVLFSCKTKTTITAKPVKAIPVSSNKAFFESINKKEDFESLEISSKIMADTGRFIPTIDGTFYIENNQKIWVNFSFLFMSQARALVTPTGIKAYEKINKTYVDSDFSYLNKMLKVNFLDYSSLQQLLLGKAFLTITEKEFSYTKSPTGIALSSFKNLLLTSDGKTREYKINLDYTAGLDLKKATLKEANSNHSLEIYYDNYEIVGLQRLPKNVKIIIKGNKTDQILIENTKFELLKMETPFSIPANYTKTEIK